MISIKFTIFILEANNMLRSNLKHLYIYIMDGIVISRYHMHYNIMG